MAARLFQRWLVLALLCSVPVTTFAKEPATSAKGARVKARPSAPSLAAVESASHQNLKQESFAAGSVLRLVGSGFGELGDAKVLLKTAGIEDGTPLTVLSWKDSEILLRLPSVSQLGMDAETVSALAKEVSTARPVVGMGASIEIVRSAAPVLDPIKIRMALAAFDFDQDGVPQTRDANDLDPATH